MRIDLLLTQPSKRAPRRVGDIGTNAPFVHLFCEGESVILPMPISVTSRGQVLWDQKDFTADSIRGATVLGAVRSRSDMSLKDLSYEAGKGFIDGLMKDVASKAGSVVGGVDGLGDYILHKKGKAVNPNKEMTFNGVGYRTFSLEFEFIPLNETEAKKITDFIAFFQEKAMPDYADNLKTYFKYPETWEIVYSELDWLPAIMPCYLTDYNINYGGAGKMAAHKGGSVQTNIALTFTESELHTRDRVRKGYVG